MIEPLVLDNVPSRRRPVHATDDGQHRSNSAAACAGPTARIFTACHGTQLLVIQHLRRHLPRPPGREFLIWHPLENVPPLDRLMSAIIREAGFDETLDIRDFESLKPRTQGRLAWLFESSRRLRQDCATVRHWLAANNIEGDNIELWADDPLHFYVPFSRAVLRRGIHVKIPHCFNHEDPLALLLKERLESEWTSLSWAKQFLFLPWQRWTSGLDLRMDRVDYDRAYTFALPSPWCANSIDLSALISIDAFSATYGSLPAATRAEVDELLAPIRASGKPLVLFLLYGLGSGDTHRVLYQQTLSRIFREHAAELQDCTLALKWHPGATGGQEELLAEWARVNLPVRVHEIPHPLNLEFMLPQLKPDYVVAGLCGSLPIVRDLHAGRPVALSEWLELYRADYPWTGQAISQFLKGIEVW